MAGRKATKQHKRVARAYVRNGQSLRRAFEEGGFSPKQAEKKGLGAVLRSGPMREAFRKELREWQKAAELVPGPAERSQLIRFRLLANLMHGDGPTSNQAARLLGQDREVSLFEPTMTVGIAALQVPNDPEWQKRYGLPAGDEESEGDGKTD